MTTECELNIAALTKFLVDHGVAIDSQIQAIKIAGGRSNLTYRISDERQAWILRRPPEAGLTPTAHDVYREYKILDALQDSVLPVPRTVLSCEDPSIIGVPFTLMSFVTGEILRTQDDLRMLSDTALESIHNELIRVLALIHSLEYEELGLRDFGQPNGFVGRQISRWRRQWDHVATREVHDIDRLHKALAESPPPEGRSSIVHGDFRIDNTLLDTTSTEVRAVLDWEMATLGDPLTDLAWMCACQHPSFDFIVGEPAASTSARWPNTDATAQRYLELTGADLTHFDHYRALAFFKLAVIAEGITARYRVGAGNGPGFATAHQAVAGLVATGLSIMS